MPEPALTVIADTTPLIALALIGQLDILRQLYSAIAIPPAVDAELVAGGSGAPGVAAVHAAPWIRAVPLHDPRRADLIADLDRGEAEVLALAQELNASLVIIDERLARRHARRLGLRLTGSVGVLLRAKKHGYIVAVKPLLTQLRSSGIRLSDALVEEALRLAREAP